MDVNKQEICAEPSVRVALEYLTEFGHSLRYELPKPTILM